MTSVPHSVEWHKKYAPQGLMLIGFHSSKKETPEEVIAYCKANKIPYPVYEKGNISGVPVQGYPHFVLFDHTGKMIYSGHPMQADAKLAEAMKTAPDWLIGEGPYKKLKALAEKAKQRKDLGQILKALKEKHLNSDDPDEKSEAEQLADKLSRYGNRLLKKAEAKKDKEPMACFNLYQEAAKLFKGDAIGDNADKIVKELKEDKAFQDNLKADKELAGMMPDIEKLKACNKCGTFNKECDACRKKNPPLQMLIPKAKNIVKKYPDSPAAVKVKELLPVE